MAALPPTPQRVLAVMAHPDDIEFMAGGTVARWARAGAELHYCLLTDGNSGDAVTLSALRGSVVAMAFLYTRCPDVCPLTAAQFRAAQQQLGADASRVRFVAVSVDPLSRSAGMRAIPVPPCMKRSPRVCVRRAPM